MDTIKIGARWDDNKQTPWFKNAKSKGLLDFVEINFPIAERDNPEKIGLPMLSHTSDNPLCSSHGINENLANLVKQGIERTQSPWTGEHLSLLHGDHNQGALGYVINPLLTNESFKISCRNIEKLKSIYGSCPIALELGPFYFTHSNQDFRNENHFISKVAQATDCKIILDITHYFISCMNLNRDIRESLKDIDKERVIEVHIAGARESANNPGYWFDSHQLPPPKEIWYAASYILPSLPNVQAMTLEYSMEGNESIFVESLEKINKMVKHLL